MTLVLWALTLLLSILALVSARDNDWNLGRITIALSVGMLALSLSLGEFIIAGVVACCTIGYWSAWHEDRKL